MTTPVKMPVLKDVTTNKLYPAYKTQKGIIIQLNGLKTVLPSGATLAALVKFADECGLKTIIITGGAEKTGHSSGSFHGKDLAIDVAGKKFNKLTDEQARNAALKAGFTHGVVVFRILCHFFKLWQKEMTYDKQNQFRYGCSPQGTA